MKLHKRKLSPSEKVVNLWYKPSLSLWLMALLPFSWLVRVIAACRYRIWKSRKIKPSTPSLPVVVVGNINVGGSGKTPLVTALCEHLKRQGWHPGIVSRGYRAKIKDFPAIVTPDSSAALYGDEPVMLAEAAQVPVVIDPDRSRAVSSLSDGGCCDIIISDDGLQHYALERSIEIVVIDGLRGLGNGYCIPAGPLRESKNRLNDVNFVVSKGPLAMNLPINSYEMNLEPRLVENLVTGDRLSCHDFVRQFPKVHAVAGIGSPISFFSLLNSLGLSVVEHVYPDHHSFSAQHISFDDELPVVMTTKDAVKCRKFGLINTWSVSVSGVVDDEFWQLFDSLVREKC